MFLESYFSNPVSILFAVFVMAIAVLTAVVFVKIFSDYSPVVHNKFQVLDGIRGYLAIGVFIHHSAIWYFNLRFEKWTVPPSNFYNNLGQASVALFFMITAFLFFNKLLNARNSKIDWYQLFISRILRIVPLYILSALVMVLIVLILSNFHIVDPVDFIKNLFKFLQFKTPNLNGFGTALINAGVTWTLRWERSFYLALPFFAFFLRLNVSWFWFSLLGASVIATIIGDKEMISLCFIGGIIGAFVVKNNFHLELFKKPIFGIFAILCLLFEIIYFKGSFNPLALFFLTIFFICAICDNSILKIFCFKAAQFLSTISYSIYLLHGIVLFVVFKFVVGFETAKSLSVLEHWLVVGVCGIILVLISSLTYHFVELPFMKMAKSKNLKKPDFVKYLSFSSPKK